MLVINEAFIDNFKRVHGAKSDVSLALVNNGMDDLGLIGQLAAHLTELDLSKNNLTDLRPLGKLTKLVRLNLSYNNISSAEGLKTLIMLEDLDLAGNAITAVGDLDSLFRLKHLTTLKLAGNAVCQTSSYPQSVFRALDYVRRVDSWSRGEVMAEQRPLARKPSQAASPALLVSVDPDQADTAEVMSLKTQVHALEDALRWQDDLMSSAAHESAVIATKGPETAALKQFPYSQLLAKWRQKVLQLNLHMVMLQKDSQKAMAEHRADLERMRASKAIAETRVAVLEAQNQTLSEQQHGLIEKLQLSTGDLTKRTDEYKRLAARCADFAQQEHRLILLINAFQYQFNCSQLYENTQQTMHIIASYEDRLANMAEHLETLREVYAEKEQNLRNTAAELALQRRMTPRQHQVTSSGPLLSDVRMPAEADSFLRTVLCLADPSDTGMMKVTSLLYLLAHTPGSICSTDISVEIDGTVLYLNDMGAELCKEFGDVLTKRLLSALWCIHTGKISGSHKELAGQEDLTIGEIYLLLLPEVDDSVPCCGLSRKEMKDLYSLRLLGDKDFSVPPRLSEGTSEVGRLKAERKYLLGRIQNMSRQLAHRAEGIKAYFEQELRTYQLQVSDQKHQLASLEEQVQVKDRREKELRDVIQNMQTNHHKAMDDWSSERKSLEAEIAKLKDARTRDHAETLEMEKKEQLKLVQQNKTLMDEVKKQKRNVLEFEKQCRLLQGEVNKSNEELKGLRSHANKAEELTELKLSNLQARHDLALRELTEKLHVLEEGKEIADSRVAIMEEELVRLREQLTQANASIDSMMSKENTPQPTNAESGVFPAMQLSPEVIAALLAQNQRMAAPPSQPALHASPRTLPMSAAATQRHDLVTPGPDHGYMVSPQSLGPLINRLVQKAYELVDTPSY